MKGISLVYLIALIVFLGNSASADDNLSSKPLLPKSIIGTYLVYNSGSVTSFEQKKVWIITTINEYYVHSRKGNTGYAARVNYNGKDQITFEDLIMGAEYQNLISQNRIYQRCANDILKPAVSFSITPMKDRKSGLYYTDRWHVKQKTKVCKNINVRHHSSDDSCETSCISYYPGYRPALKNMRLYISKSAALADSRSR